MKKYEIITIGVCGGVGITSTILTIYCYYKHLTDGIIFYGIMAILNYLVSINLFNKAENEKQEN